jgi:hypothetical protein
LNALSGQITLTFLMLFVLQRSVLSLVGLTTPQPVLAPFRWRVPMQSTFSTLGL